MKNLSWQQWTIIGIVAAIVICGVTLHLIQPKVSYAFTEIIAAAMFVTGGACGYLFAKNGKCEKQLLND